MIDQRESGIEPRFRRQKIAAQLIRFGEVSAALEKQILELNVWQHAPAAVAFARWQFRQQILHVREGLQENLLRLLVDFRRGISSAAALRVFLRRFLELVADADEVNHEAARLVAENPVHASD